MAGRTALVRRLHTWPYSVGRVFPHEGGADPAQVIVQSGSGGIITGDLLRQRLTAAEGAHARVLGQGAVSVHRRGARAGAGEHLQMEAATGAWLENLAEPRVLFDGSDFTQRTTIDARGGSMIAVESIVALDGAFSYESEFDIRAEGETVARERMRVHAGDLPRGMSAFGLVLFVGGDSSAPPDLDDRWRAWHSEFGSSRVYGTVSPLPFEAGLSVRVAAVDGRLLRTALAAAIGVLRSEQDRPTL